LSIIFVLEPGTARFERRERSGRVGSVDGTEVILGGYSAPSRVVTEVAG
jgi:hypothetical protein